MPPHDRAPSRALACLARRLTAIALPLLVALAGPAAAARPELDVASAPPDAAMAARVAALVADPQLSAGGHAPQVDERFGVPSFVWGGAVARPAGAPAGAQASVAPAEAARGHLARLASAWRLDADDVAGATVRDVDASGSGGIVVTFGQSFDGVEVFRDAVKVLMTRDRELVAIAGSIPGRAEAGPAGARAFQLDGREAVARALEDFTAQPADRGAIREAGAAAGGYAKFALAPAPAGADPEAWPAGAVRAKRVLFHVPGELVPAWYVELIATRDAASYVVSARDGSLLFRHDLVADDAYTYRVWADPVSQLSPDDPAGTAVTPHPTGLPDFYDAPFLPPSLVSLQNAAISTNDPWLAPGATQTSGNNVDAYADLVSPDGFSAGDFRASTTGPNTFDRVYDTSQPPSLSTDQQMASITQLFYVDNFLHDWYYDSGFDEAAGNAQVSNYGRGGVEGDPLHAEAEDYSGLNNANMLTPADGTSPRQQMYVWQPGPLRRLQIVSPSSLAGYKTIGDADANPPTFNLQAPVVLPNSPVFNAGTTSAVAMGSGLEWVLPADLDGDGKIDLASANYTSGDVSVRLGNGDGTFQAAVSYPMSAGPFTVMASDLNHDGKLDLVCANNGASTFSVRLGTGGGAFGAKTDFATGAATSDAAIARLDADGNDDVVTSNFLDNSVSVFLGDGTGGFGARTDYATGANPNWVEVGDVNLDGKNDLVTANDGDGSISVLLGTGTGTFGAKTDFATGAGPLTLALGDVNGDNRLDVVTANTNDNTVSVLLGNGTGGFGAPTSYTVPATPVTVRLADMTGDGILDIVVCCDLSNEVAYLRGQGNGTFAGAIAYPVGTTPYGAAVADVTGDGTADLLTANDGSNDVTVVSGQLTSVPELCPPFSNAMTGRIALIDRGAGTGCNTFLQKAQGAVAMGAAGVLIANNVATAPPAMTLGTSPGVPVLMVSQADGNAFKAALRAGVPVVGSMTSALGAKRDGAIDNQIVAHEWGHYLCNRLINNAAGITNTQGHGMSEGWADFSAMLLTVRAEDASAPAGPNFSGTYGLGGYAASSTLQPTNVYYYGIRRYPYSTDMTKNPLTFIDIQQGTPLPVGPPVSFGADGAQNQESHNTGEVWCSMLWECYASLLRDTGRYTFAQACDRMRRYLVASLKLTPASPTFVEARDAVLAAAVAQDIGDYSLFCAAFARRGIGTGAVAPDRTSTTQVGVTESYACGAVAVDPPPTAVLSFALRGSNPVVGEAQFAFLLPRAGEAALDVYSVAGRRVATLARGPLAAGEHTATWSAPPASGVYFARLRALGESRVVRVVVVTR